MVDMSAVEVWFFVLWSIVFSVTIWLIFMVSKDANYKIGYKDGYIAGLSEQTNCMVRHMHDMVDTVVSDGVSTLLEEDKK
jgi:hypothetical protein|tara:strand:+ start:427 stop:666 length:240 start_codon:yes stop_codon:yes gene_type:complete